MSESFKKEFITRYKSDGDQKFYQFLMTYAMTKLIALSKNEIDTSPDIELMEYYDKFMSLYRQDDEEDLLKIAKVFRKAAHKIYRTMLKKDMTERNSKFLNLV